MNDNALPPSSPTTPHYRHGGIGEATCDVLFSVPDSAEHGGQLCCSVLRSEPHAEHEALLRRGVVRARAPNANPAPAAPAELCWPQLAPAAASLRHAPKEAPGPSLERYRHGREGDLACGTLIYRGLESYLAENPLALVCTVLEGVAHEEHEASDGFGRVFARAPAVPTDAVAFRATLLGKLSIQVGTYLARDVAGAREPAAPASDEASVTLESIDALLLAMSTSPVGRRAIGRLINAGDRVSPSAPTCNHRLARGGLCTLSPQHRLPLHIAHSEGGSVLAVEPKAPAGR